jgi:hypothetical protein
MQSSTSTAAATALQPGLTSSEIEQAKLHLEQSRRGVVGALTGLSEAQWRFKPAPDCWSIAEIAEHVVTVQDRVLGMLQHQLPTAPASSADRNLQLVDAIIINRFPTRLAKFSAPEFLLPKGDCSLSEAIDRVSANTGKFCECLESIPDLRGHVLESAPLKAITKGEYVVMDGYQWILAASAHTERHTKQILEVRADSGFPTS